MSSSAPRTVDANGTPDDVTRGGESALNQSRGTLIGRFVVLDRIGEGGMGVVYKAYDPELDRLVAMKFLRSGADDRAESTGRTRLLREAKALARLNHPNVLAVFDVGTLGADVFLATEFVEGPTLTTWLTSQPRSRAEILAAFVAAGEGLAAAHRAGLVHRDFKPANVMVGTDGRVRVLDFGVARITAGDPTTDRHRKGASSPPEMTDADVARPLTVEGQVVGTPRYMAPEQHLGEIVTPKADQFSFALSLYEALYGEAPFEGTGTEYVTQLVLGQVRRPRAGADVPRWIRAVLVRALDASHEKRYPTMEALLVALQADPALKRRRWIVGGVVTAGLALAVGAGLATQRARTGMCRGGDAKLAGVWDPDRRDAVTAALTRTSAPYAQGAARSVAHILDDYARAWSDGRREACEATRVRGEQSEELLDLRMQCFDERLAEMRERTSLLANADAVAAERAVESVRGLPPLSSCNDVAGLRSPVRLPSVPQARERLESLRTHVARSNALTAAIRVGDAMVEAATAVDEARALDYAPALAEALRSRAAAEEKSGKYGVAAATYRDAITAAETGHSEEQAARGWAELIQVLGDRLGQLDEARGLLWIARAKDTRLTDPQDIPARLQLVEATVAWRQGKPAEAEPLARTAVASFEQVRGARSPETAKAVGWLGLILEAEGKGTEAEECRTRDLATMEEVFGAEHPSTVPSLTHIADARGSRGDHRGALEIYERVLRIEERSLGPAHPMVGKIYNNLADELLAAGRIDEAIVDEQRAIAIWDKSVGPDNFDMATGLFNLGTAYVKKQDGAAALPALQRSLEISSKVYGPSHYVLVGVLLARGSAFRLMGDVDHARDSEARALAIDAQLPPAERSYETAVRVSLAEIMLASGLTARAADTLKDALPEPGKPDDDPAMTARIRSALARAGVTSTDHAPEHLTRNP